MQDGEEGDSFMQCPFTETLLDTIGHGVYRSIKYTNGLPRRVELNSNGSMRTEKKDAKKGTLHFNCPCVHKFRTVPLVSEALQVMLQKLGEPSYSAPVTSAVDMQNSSHAATAVGVAAAVKTGGRVRKLSKKSQQIQQEEEEKKKKGKEKKEKKRKKLYINNNNNNNNIPFPYAVVQLHCFDLFYDYLLNYFFHYLLLFLICVFCNKNKRKTKR